MRAGISVQDAPRRSLDEHRCPLHDDLLARYCPQKPSRNYGARPGFRHVPEFSDKRRLTRPRYPKRHEKEMAFLVMMGAQVLSGFTNRFISDRKSTRLNSSHRTIS